MVVCITQHGTDGFGHQLHGLFTCLIMHNIENYYFDGVSFIEKQFNFEHVTIVEGTILKEYLVESIKLFIHNYNLSKKVYSANIRSLELCNIPANYDINCLYSLDNVFLYERIFANKPDVLQKITDNIFHMKNYFINNKLPANRLVKNSIVIHVRLGDALAGRSSTIYPYNRKICDLIKLFKTKYPEHHYYIHSDGEPKQIIETIGSNYTFYNKNSQVLDVLSDLLHASILICGFSSLSLISGYIGNQDLIITHDECDLSIPNINAYKISKYMSLLKNEDT